MWKEQQLHMPTDPYTKSLLMSAARWHWTRGTYPDYNNLHAEGG